MTVLNATLPVSFYERPTLAVSRDLLGCVLNRRFPSGALKQALITEVEAYTQDDPACHAFRGMTKRNQVLFGEPGIAYVYFIYGMYNCLNVVTESNGVPGAVLIRGVSEPGLDGPGKLCREWEIDRSHNGINLMDVASQIWISPRREKSEPKIGVSKRIGITQSEAKEFLWRFFLIADQESPAPRKGGKSGKRT